MGHPAGEIKGSPMNVLPRDKRIAVLAALVEGNSERAVERMTDVNRETVGRLSLEFGRGAQRLHDRLARDLMCSQIVADEVWSYCLAKEARVRNKHMGLKSPRTSFRGWRKFDGTLVRKGQQ